MVITVFDKSWSSQNNRGPRWTSEGSTGWHEMNINIIKNLIEDITNKPFFPASETSVLFKNVLYCSWNVWNHGKLFSSFNLMVNIDTCSFCWSLKTSCFFIWWELWVLCWTMGGLQVKTVESHYCTRRVGVLKRVLCCPSLPPAGSTRLSHGKDYH